LNQRLLPYGLLLFFVLGIFLYFGFGILQTATHHLAVSQLFKKRPAGSALKKPAVQPSAGLPVPTGLGQKNFSFPNSESTTSGFASRPGQEKFSNVSNAAVWPTWLEIGMVPPGGEAYLVVSAKRKAYVAIDGSPQGKVPPPRAFKLAAGKHTIVYSYPGFKTKIKEVKLKAGDSKLANEDLRREKKRGGS
jgi:hypothetical protein